jgi:hypothetical protein
MQVSFVYAVPIGRIEVFETYNPSAIYKISARLDSTQPWSILWQGEPDFVYDLLNLQLSLLLYCFSFQTPLEVLWNMTVTSPNRTYATQPRIFSPPIAIFPGNFSQLRLDINITDAPSWYEIDAIRISSVEEPSLGNSP